MVSSRPRRRTSPVRWSERSTPRIRPAPTSRMTTRREASRRRRTLSRASLGIVSGWIPRIRAHGRGSPVVVHQSLTRGESRGYAWKSAAVSASVMRRAQLSHDTGASAEAQWPAGPHRAAAACARIAAATAGSTRVPLSSCSFRVAIGVRRSAACPFASFGVSGRRAGNTGRARRPSRLELLELRVNFAFQPAAGQPRGGRSQPCQHGHQFLGPGSRACPRHAGTPAAVDHRHSAHLVIVAVARGRRPQLRRARQVSIAAGHGDRYDRDAASEGRMSMTFEVETELLRSPSRLSAAHAPGRSARWCERTQRRDTASSGTTATRPCSRRPRGRCTPCARRPSPRPDEIVQPARHVRAGRVGSGSSRRGHRASAASRTLPGGGRDGPTGKP